MGTVFRCLLCSASRTTREGALSHAQDEHSLSANAKDYIIERQTDDLAGDRE